MLIDCMVVEHFAVEIKLRMIMIWFRETASYWLRKEDNALPRRRNA